MSETRVRLASRDDEAQMMDLCRALHADNGLFSFDEDMVRGMLNRAFDKQGGIIGVIDGKKEIAGAIFVLISNFWYSRDNHLEELFSFIRPAYRKTNYAGDLIEFAKRCSDKIAIPLVIGVVSNNRTATKVRLYRRRLGVPAGAFFLYNAQWSSKTEPDDALWRMHTRGRERKALAAEH